MVAPRSDFFFFVRRPAPCVAGAMETAAPADAMAKLGDAMALMNKRMGSVDLDVRFEAVAARLSNIEAGMADVKTIAATVESQGTRLADLEAEVTGARQEMANIRSRLEVAEAATVESGEEWDRKLAALEDRDRLNNLVFHGLHVTDPDECGKAVAWLCHSYMDFTLKDEYVQRVHFLPAGRAGGPKPIIVRFSTWKCREQVWVLAKRLRGTQFRVSENFSALTRRARNVLFPVFLAEKRAAGSHGPQPRLTRERVSVGATSFRLHGRKNKLEKTHRGQRVALLDLPQADGTTQQLPGARAQTAPQDRRECASSLPSGRTSPATATAAAASTGLDADLQPSTWPQLPPGTPGRDATAPLAPKPAPFAAKTKQTTLQLQVTPAARKTPTAQTNRRQPLPEPEEVLLDLCTFSPKTTARWTRASGKQKRQDRSPSNGRDDWAEEMEATGAAASPAPAKRAREKPPARPSTRGRVISTRGRGNGRATKTATTSNTTTKSRPPTPTTKADSNCSEVAPLAPRLIKPAPTRSPSFTSAFEVFDRLGKSAKK